MSYGRSLLAEQREALKHMQTSHILRTVTENLTGVFHREIHSPAALNISTNPPQASLGNLERHHITICSHVDDKSD